MVDDRICRTIGGLPRQPVIVRVVTVGGSGITVDGVCREPVKLIVAVSIVLNIGIDGEDVAVRIVAVTALIYNVIVRVS